MASKAARKPSAKGKAKPAAARKPVTLARAAPASKVATATRTASRAKVVKVRRTEATRKRVDAASQPADAQSRGAAKQLTLGTGPSAAPSSPPAAPRAGPASAPERVPLHQALAGFKSDNNPATGSPVAANAPDVPRARIAVARPATILRIKTEHQPDFEPSPRRPVPYTPKGDDPVWEATPAAPASPAGSAVSPARPNAPVAASALSTPSAAAKVAPVTKSSKAKSSSPAASTGPARRLVARAPRPGAPAVATPETPLRCKSWRTEAILRMLENNLHNAEEPDKLIVYGGTGKAARNPKALEALRATLTNLGDDETMLVQSGKPVAVFKTWPHAPRVLIANSHLVPRWSTWEAFNQLEQMGLTMYGQMTAGSWCYIGTQGIIQGTYETFAQAARTHFGAGATLRHRIVLTGGLGGMGGAQPRAVTMSGGVCLAIEVDPARAQRRKESGFLDVIAPDLRTGRELAERAARAGESLAIAVIGNAGDDFATLLANGFAPHLVTDQTSAHDPLSYVPSGYSVKQSEELRKADPEQHRAKAYQSMARHVHAMVGFLNQGSHVFDYGNNIREGAVTGGLPRDAAYSFPGFVPAYIRPMFCEGRGPFRWVSLRGDLRDIERTEDLLLSMFPENKVLTNWIHLARTTLPVEGLPARVCWLGMGERDAFALAMNELVAAGKIGPIAVTRDHLDSGSVASPFRETESMLDGSDAIADWPILNAMVNIAAGADSVHLHNGGGVGIGYSTHAGMVVVLDGSDLAREKAARVFRTDPGMGVVRHVDAGYPKAAEVAKATGVRTPLV